MTVKPIGPPGNALDLTPSIQAVACPCGSHDADTLLASFDFTSAWKATTLSRDG